MFTRWRTITYCLIHVSHSPSGMSGNPGKLVNMYDKTLSYIGYIYLMENPSKSNPYGSMLLAN